MNARPVSDSNDAQPTAETSVGGDAASTSWTLLADNQEFPDAIAVDDTDVYWADAHASMVMKCGKSGCNDTPTVLASPERGMWTIALSTTDIYWNTPNEPGPNDGPGPIMKCAKTGCRHPSVVVQEAWPWGMVTDGTTLYWTDKTGQVLKCSPGCTTPTVIASNENGPGPIAIDATDLYWSNQQGPGSIMSCALAGCGGNATVTASSAFAHDLVVLAGQIVWSTLSGEIWRCSLPSCTDRALVIADGTLERITADLQNVYWTSSSMGVRTCPLAAGCGGEALTLIAPAYNAMDIVSDATSVYWTEGISGVADFVKRAVK